VLENVPAQSHLQFDALLSMSTMQQPAMLKDWSNHFVRTYVELAPGTDVGALERKLPAFLRKYMGKDAAKSFELFLQPLGEVHGGSADITHDYNNHRKFERRYSSLFVALALAVLGIAVLNFINLSTARAAQRAKEVGIRKAIGAFRMQIAAQFVGESVLLSGLALVLALGLVYLALPLVRTLSERDLQLPLFTNPWLVPVVLAATVTVGVLSGLYPAAFLSAFGPAQVLKGAGPGVGKKATFRNLLVVGQFAAGILLLIGTIVSTRQVRYMLHRNPGFDREQVVVLTMDATAGQQYQTLRQELLRQPGVTDVTASGQRLGNNLHQTVAAFRGEGPLRKLNVSQLVADVNYLSFYKIALVAGRGFSPAGAAGSRQEYVINESLARELLGNTPGRPFETLIGKAFGFGSDDADGTIVGIVRDFHFNSLHHKVETLAIAATPNVGYGEVSVRVAAGQAPATIRRAEALWRRLAPTQPFEYAFLDDHFGQLYRADAQVSQVVALLAGLAVLIACLGLFGLALYTTQRRTKEIGIRKVFGASVGSLVALLSGDFLKLVVVAFLLAAPVAWWTLRAWLDQFAYRIPMGWWPFALAGLLAVGVAWLTVAFQSVRTARTNPVKSLRSE
jgi:putative ABC transport system permease protein